MRHRRLIALGLALLFFAAEASQGPAQDASRPNIVFVMADDLGYGDLPCYNPDSKIPTRHLDRLAAEGMRFTDAHAPAAVCVPTRYGLLTGRYPFRMPSGRNSRLEADRLTLPGLLKRHEYATACVGKWHLGFDVGRDPDYSKPLTGGPVDRGFDHYFGIPASLDIPPYYYIRDDRAIAAPTVSVDANYSPDVKRIQGAFWRAGKMSPGFRHDQVLPAFAKEALKFLENHHRSAPDQPFFLYLALTAPHTPWLPTEPYQGKSRAGSYGDFVFQVDDVLGQVLKKLDDLKVTDNTLVFFTSDNGPVWYEVDSRRYDHRSSGPLRGMKGDAWEGGHRMPFIARWPGRIRAGTTSNETICHTDMIATFADVLKSELPENAGEDSYSILPVLLGEEIKGTLREATVLQSSRRVLAVRQGPWKLIPALGSAGFSEPRSVEPRRGGPQGQLYNLEEDLGETENVYLENPEIVSRLTRLLERYKSEGRSRPQL